MMTERDKIAQILCTYIGSGEQRVCCECPFNNKCLAQRQADSLIEHNIGDLSAMKAQCDNIRSAFIKVLINHNLISVCSDCYNTCLGLPEVVGECAAQEVDELIGIEELKLSRNNKLDELNELRNIVMKAGDKEGIAKRCPNRIAEAVYNSGYRNKNELIDKFIKDLEHDWISCSSKEYGNFYAISEDRLLELAEKYKES